MTKTLTVKQLADLAGVTVRTLHYYDQINLLQPERASSNGYRQYDETSLHRLQQIMFYRELGLSLDEISGILDDPDFIELQALQDHRAALCHQIERLQELVKTVDNTISYLKGERPMIQNEFFKGFNAEKQAEYEEEIAMKYGNEVLAASKKVWDSSTQEERQVILTEGQKITLALVDSMPAGPGGPAAQAQVEAWRNYLSRNFWTPDDDQFMALGLGYAEHPDFRATYEAIQPGLADFFAQAITIYTRRRKAG